MRIDKLLTECGLATRKEASLAARRGLISVDGCVVKDASVHVNPDECRVVYMGEPVTYRKYTYIMLNKPSGYVSATEDSRLPVVTQLLSEQYRKMDMFPVGRLDRDTLGLMILTNDGNLAHRLLTPKRHVEKRYRFKCAEPLCDRAEQTFRVGLTLGDGYECKSAELLCDTDRLGGIITLTEGKYHQIKRMLGALGNKVTYLERISFADLTLDSSLERGEWRLLYDDEIESLRDRAK